MKKLIFSAAASAVVTPFIDGKVDYASFERLIEMQIAGGISALVVLGTTGEAATVTYEERDEILRFAVETVASRVPVIAGCGSNCTENACSMVKKASAVGVDGVLSVTPYYNKGSKQGLCEHFEAIADASDVPVIIYNVPSRTGVDLPLEVIEKLAEKEHIVGIKEASGSVAKSAAICSLLGDEMPVYSGSDEINLPILSVGGVGCISVLSNLIPREVSELCRLVFAGKLKEASLAFSRSFSLTRALFCDVNPIPVKCALSMLGICADEVRLPLTALDGEKKKMLRCEMAQSGFFKGFSAE